MLLDATDATHTVARIGVVGGGEPIGGSRAQGVQCSSTGKLEARGVLRASASLTSSADAVRVHTHEGRPTLIDGPFAEAKEMIGGFFLLDVATREEAIAIAAECPAAEWCSVEVRKLGACYD